MLQCSVHTTEHKEPAVDAGLGNWHN